MRILIAGLMVLFLASLSYAMSSDEFHTKWSENHYVIVALKRLNMLKYVVKSYHSYHWRVTELKTKPNKTEGSQAWVLKRIVYSKPDAIIISFVPTMATHPLMSFPRDVACVEFHKKVPRIVWRADDDGSDKSVDAILRAEGYCPI